jgi:hypothetical protein
VVVVGASSSLSELARAASEEWLIHKTLTIFFYIRYEQHLFSNIVRRHESRTGILNPAGLWLARTLRWSIARLYYLYSIGLATRLISISTKIVRGHDANRDLGGEDECFKCLYHFCCFSAKNRSSSDDTEVQASVSNLQDRIVYISGSFMSFLLPET